MGLCISSLSRSKTGLHSHDLPSDLPSTRSQFLEDASESSRGIITDPGKILKSPNLRVFSLLELTTATKNFRPEAVLGEGGFGKVYRGWVQAETLAPSGGGSGMTVAVKRLSSESFQGFEEWRTAINFLGVISHPNLVKLLGYCREDKEHLLVYEFMPKGSLDYHLFERKESFPWDLRMKIMIGAARGLAFLHGPQRQVIYRGFKPSQILLDSNYEAKISGFGLAKLGPPQGNSHVTTRVMGTCGYAAPEYMATGHLYFKSDVYAFGVVLLEVMTGLRVRDPKRPQGQTSLVDWLRPKLSSKHKVNQIMDKRIKGQYSSKVANEMGRIIHSCTEPDPKNRPHMKEVLEVLEDIQHINVVPGRSSTNFICATSHSSPHHY